MSDNIQPMSEYEKFLFDLKGFIVIPEALTEREIETVREESNYSADDKSFSLWIHTAFGTACVLTLTRSGTKQKHSQA